MNMITPDMVGWGMTGIGTMAGALYGGPQGAAIGAEVGNLAGSYFGGLEQKAIDSSGAYGGGSAYTDNPAAMSQAVQLAYYWALKGWVT